MSETPGPRQYELAAEFRQALADCRDLYRSSATDTVELDVKPRGGSTDEFVKWMLRLHQGLLIKVFVETVQADDHWSDGERLLAEELAEHLWNERLSGERLEQRLRQSFAGARKLRWRLLLGPFAQSTALRWRCGELQTIVMRLANLVAKIDGRLHPDTVRHLTALESEMWRYLGGDCVEEEADHDDIDVDDAVETADGEETTDSRSKEERLADALAELDGLIGLNSLKHEVHQLVSFLKVQTERTRLGLSETSVSLHMVFGGNPGTGKTTVARLVGKIFGAMGILAKGHLVETDRSGLVAVYLGQTAPKTNKKIDEALDGVLFIDEAYSLHSGNDRDTYGDEALQVILKRAEDDRDRLVVIMAGYPKPMHRLLKSNPGLSSRFSHKLEFPNYSALELCQIFQLFCEKNNYILPPTARVRLMTGFDHAVRRADEHFGNGRLARNVFQRAIRRQASRVAPITPLTREVLMTLEADDIVIEGVPLEILSDPAAQTRQLNMRCPHCEAPNAISPATLGKTIICRTCGKSVRADWGELSDDPPGFHDSGN